MYAAQSQLAEPASARVLHLGGTVSPLCLFIRRSCHYENGTHEWITFSSSGDLKLILSDPFFLRRNHIS